jgi:hypothetical protein
VEVTAGLLCSTPMDNNIYLHCLVVQEVVLIVVSAVSNGEVCCDEKRDAVGSRCTVMRSRTLLGSREAVMCTGMSIAAWCMLCGGGVPLDVRLTDQRSSVHRSG